MPDVKAINAASLGRIASSDATPALSPRNLSIGSTSPDTAQFASLLAKSGSKNSAQTPEQKARSAAEQFVAVALVQPLLKQLRETNNAAPPFAPTSGEKQFQSLYDAEIAQRMVKAAHFPLVDRLSNDLLKKQAPKAGLPKPKAAVAPSVELTG